MSKELVVYELFKAACRRTLPHPEFLRFKLTSDRWMNFVIWVYFIVDDQECSFSYVFKSDKELVDMDEDIDITYLTNHVSRILCETKEDMRRIDDRVLSSEVLGKMEEG